MKKFVFLILSLALAIGCQPAEDKGGSSGGGATPATTDDSGDDGGTDDSAATTTDDATKLVSLEITSKLA